MTSNPNPNHHSPSSMPPPTSHHAAHRHAHPHPEGGEPQAAAMAATADGPIGGNQVNVQNLPPHHPSQPRARWVKSPITINTIGGGRFEQAIWKPSESLLPPPPPPPPSTAPDA
ncbi:hypothetical protein H4R33_005048 [Dimargaris cristalligena]|nr:hypothetical protein H4R33_005048 [Dimargaris cristalligena]